MFAFSAYWLAAFGQIGSGELFAGPGEREPRFQIQAGIDRLSPPKKSPKQKWEFEYSTGAYGKQDSNPEVPLGLKFRVFAQMRKERDDPAPKVARLLLRLWDYAYRVIATDHSTYYNNGIIDVYLCFGGEAGGEQLYDEEIENGFVKRVNTIYIYRMPSFIDPLEMAREVSHEYGHAILPPIGGFKQPEDWANGYLGERIFMRRLRDDLAAKRLTEADTMGATLPQLNAFVATKVDPLWLSVARNGIRGDLLASTGQKAMDAYLGTALYAQSVLPPAAFARSLRLTGSWKAADYPAAIVAATAERPSIDLRVPSQLAKAPFWIPLPSGSRVVSGATVQKRSGDWAVVVPTASTIRLTNSKS